MAKKICRFVTTDFMARFASVDATEVVEHMRQMQSTHVLSTVALGRAMVGATLMASHLKGRQEVAVDFQVDGPLQRVYAQASVQGGVRGYVYNPQVGLSPEQTSLSLKTAMGGGQLTVTSFLPHQTVPHRGMVSLASGEIGEDIAEYYMQSLQIPTLVSLGVSLSSEGEVAAAGGVLVELMPGAPEGLISTLEANSASLAGPSQRILQGSSPEDLVRELAKGLSIRQIEHPHEVHYSCQCSKERVLRSLGLLEDDELKDAIEAEEVLSIQCQMCGTWYSAGSEDIQSILDLKSRGDIH